MRHYFLDLKMQNFKYPDIGVGALMFDYTAYLTFVEFTVSKGVVIKYLLNGGG